MAVRCATIVMVGFILSSPAAYAKPSALSDIVSNTVIIISIQDSAAGKTGRRDDTISGSTKPHSPPRHGKPKKKRKKSGFRFHGRWLSAKCKIVPVEPASETLKYRHCRAVQSSDRCGGGPAVIHGAKNKHSRRRRTCL